MHQSVNDVTLSNFVTCRKRCYNQSVGGGLYLSFGALHLTLISKIFKLLLLSDFVVCSTRLYVWSNGDYI